MCGSTNFGNPQQRRRHGPAAGASLITVTTYRRTPFFADLYLGRVVVNTLRASHDHGRIVSLAFVVMPDHLHWIVQLPPGPPLATVIEQIKAHSAWRINTLRHSQQLIWESGFDVHRLRHPNDVRRAARWVVGNPVRLSLVASVGDYPLWDAIWL